MAATGTPTPNIGLRIPQGTDPASVDDINYNSNLLDTKLGAVGNTSVQDQIDSLNSKITPSAWENIDTEYATIRIRKASNVCHIWIYTDKAISANTVIGVVPSGYRFSSVPYPNRIYCFDGIAMKKLTIHQDGDITLIDTNSAGNWVCLSATWVIG